MPLSLQSFAVPAVGFSLLMASAFAMAAEGFAGSAAERESLARLSSEIEALYPLIDEAKRSSAQPSGRFRFEYSWLKRDLERIKQGIDEWLAQPDTTPREITPLGGDYTQ